MKILSLIFLILIVTGLPLVSSATSVAANLRMPFNCGSANELVRQTLKEECQKISTKLVSFTLDQCQPDGDDGGYVNYFVVNAIGECR